MQLTDEEIAFIQDRRLRNAETMAYNRGLDAAYRLVQTMPLSETRTEVLGQIMSLRKEYS